METRNVTLSLPESLLRRFKVYAASHDTSMSSLMTEAVEKIVCADDVYEKARKRMIEHMESAPRTGWSGKVTWTRDEIYDR